MNHQQNTSRMETHESKTCSSTTAYRFTAWQLGDKSSQTEVFKSVFVLDRKRKLDRLNSVKYPLLQKPKNPKVGPNWRAKRWELFGIFQRFCRKTSKCQKKLEQWTLWSFSTSIVSQNIEKIEGRPFVEIFSEKYHNAEKNGSGDLSVPPGIVCYAKKNFFWFSLLGQMVQFDTMKLRRTFRNYFTQFVWTISVIFP